MKEPATYPPGRASARESWLPLLAGAVLTVLALGAWQAFAAPRIPEPTMHPNRFDGRLFWVGPRLGPFYSKQDVEAAELLFVGDSRIYDGIDLDVVREEGAGPAALVWGPNADLSIVLPAVAQLPAQRLVVALSPSTLGARTNPIMGAVFAEPVPDLAPLSLESSVLLWSADQRQRLLAEDFPPLAVDVILPRMHRIVRETVLRGSTSTREVDRWVRERSNYWRTRTFRTVEPRVWHREWYEAPEPSRADAGTRNTLGDITPEQRDAAEAAVVEVLRGLREGGRDVVCVRLPISRSQLAVEREFVADERLRALAERAGVPLLEYHDDPSWGTRDGSHLVWSESRRFTRELLARLRDGDS